VSYDWSAPSTRFGTPCARVTAREVVFWLDTGNPHTEAGTACTHAEFLGGTLHDTARSTLGDAALREMLVVVRGAPEDPRFSEELRELREARAMLAALRPDPTLPALLADPRLKHGRWFDQPRGSFKLPAPLAGRGHVNGAVQVGGLWVVDLQCCAAFDAAGAVRSPAALYLPPWGTLLRGWDVYALDERTFFSFTWYHRGDGPPGVCEFRPDEGFVGYCDLLKPPALPPPPPKPFDPYERRFD
jgi:hypothetical protein